MATNFNRYICTIDYFATGEGNTSACMQVLAKNKKEAIDKFLRATMLNHTVDEKHIKEGIKYFSLCVKIYSVDNKKDLAKVKDYLTAYLTPKAIDYMLDASENHALHDFSFKLYVNFS